MPWMIQRVALIIAFFRESLPHEHAYSPNRHSNVHTNGKEWICSDIPTTSSLHAQIPTVHTLSALFLPVPSYTFSRLLVLGVQLSVRPPTVLLEPMNRVRGIIGKCTVSRQVTRNEKVGRYGRWTGHHTGNSEQIR